MTHPACLGLRKTALRLPRQGRLWFLGGDQAGPQGPFLASSQLYGPCWPPSQPGLLCARCGPQAAGLAPVDHSEGWARSVLLQYFWGRDSRNLTIGLERS